MYMYQSLKQLKNRLEEIGGNTITWLMCWLVSWHKHPAGTAMQADAAHTVKVERDKKLAEIKAQQRAEVRPWSSYDLPMVIM